MSAGANCAAEQACCAGCIIAHPEVLRLPIWAPRAYITTLEVQTDRLQGALYWHTCRLVWRKRLLAKTADADAGRICRCGCTCAPLFWKYAWKHRALLGLHQLIIVWAQPSKLLIYHFGAKYSWPWRIKGRGVCHGAYLAVRPAVVNYGRTRSLSITQLDSGPSAPEKFYLLNRA